MTDSTDVDFEALQAQALAEMQSMTVTVAEPAPAPQSSVVPPNAAVPQNPTPSPVMVDSKYGTPTPEPLPTVASMAPVPTPQTYRMPWPQGVQPGAKPNTTMVPSTRGPWTGVPGVIPAHGIPVPHQGRTSVAPLTATGPVAVNGNANGNHRPGPTAPVIGVAPVPKSAPAPVAAAPKVAPSPVSVAVATKPAPSPVSAAPKHVPTATTIAPSPASKTEWKSENPPEVKQSVTHVEPPLLEKLTIPKIMSSEFLARVVELFSTPATDLNWPNLIDKVASVKDSVLTGDVLRQLIGPRIAICKETVARDKHHSSAAYLAFLMYMHEKLIEIKFSTNSVIVRFNGSGELSIPPVRQFVLRSGNERFPWDVCQDNKVEEVLSEPVTFVISDTLDLVLTGELPKLGKKGKLSKKMKNMPNIPIGLDALLDPEEKRVQKDFKTKKPILQVNSEGKPLIYRTGPNTSIYVPYRSRLWISVTAGRMVEVQKLSIPNIGLSARAPVGGSNASGKLLPKAVGKPVTEGADTASGIPPPKKASSSKSHRHSSRRRSPSPPRSDDEDEQSNSQSGGSSDEQRRSREKPRDKGKARGSTRGHGRSNGSAGGGGGGGGGFLDQLRNMARR